MKSELHCVRCIYDASGNTLGGTVVKGGLNFTKILSILEAPIISLSFFSSFSTGT